MSKSSEFLEAVAYIHAFPPVHAPFKTGISLVYRLFIIILAAMTLLFLYAGCGGSGQEESAARSHGQMAKNSGRHPGGQRSSQPPIPVATEKAFRGSISSYYTATATLEAEKEAEILARVTGVVETLSCEEGDLVEKGSELLRIENEEYKLRLAEAEARTSNLRDRFNRLKDMWDQKLVSAEEYQTVNNELKGAKASEDLSRLNLSYTRVTSPYEGRIVRRLVDVGQNVNIATPLFVISDFDPLLARVHVPSKEFKKLKPEQPVELILDSNKEKLKGKIKLVSPVIDPSSGTIKVTVEISEYLSMTRPGDFAEVRIVTENHTGITLVPKIAVFSDRGDQIVYIAADRTAERRVVEIGFDDGVNTEILSGIDVGEEVVVKGQRSLKHGAPIKVMNRAARSDSVPRREGS